MWRQVTTTAPRRRCSRGTARLLYQRAAPAQTTSTLLRPRQGALVVRQLRGKFSHQQPLPSIFSGRWPYADYVLGIVMGAGAGYLIWGRTMIGQQEKINKLTEQLRYGAELGRGDMLDKAHSDPKVLTVVLTGGPCGGKSTALATLTNHLRSKGYEVYSIPEVPTLVFTAGVPPISSMNEEQLLAFEKQVLTIQIHLEESMKKIASAMNKPTVILLDRAALDISAYLPYPFWKKLLSDIGLTEKQIRERYDAVVHLVTAANGAEQYYTLSNNSARTEGLQQARELDDKVKHAWIAHTKTFVADNRTDFGGKMQKVCNFLDELLTARQQQEGAAKQSATHKEEAETK